MYVSTCMFNGSTSPGDADGIDQRLTACSGEVEYSTLRRSDPPPPPPLSPCAGIVSGAGAGIAVAVAVRITRQGRVGVGVGVGVGVAVGVVWREIVHPVGRLRPTANTSSLA